jgi:putative chitobiose transport system substrate-binding protein
MRDPSLVLSRRQAIGCIAGSCALPLLHGCETRSRNSSGAIAIEFWTLALAPFESFIRERIAAFESLHPHVSVTWVDVPFDALDRKLIAAASAKRAPDVVNLSDRSFARYVALGGMLDISTLLPGNPDTTYLPGALSLGKINVASAAGSRARGLLALPWYLTTSVGLVNTELLGAGGIEASALSRDWRSLWRQARDYHRATGNHLFSQPLGEESQMPIMLLGEGLSPLIERDGRLRADFTRDEIVDFISGWVTLYRDGALPAEAATSDHGHLTNMYQNRELALIDTGPNFLNRVRDNAPSVFAQTQVRPPVTGALGRAHIATMVLGVTVQSRHPREAAALAWHMTSAESQLGLCRLAPVLPSAAAGLDDPMFALDQSIDDADLPRLGRRLSAQSLRSAVAFTPRIDVWPDLRRALEAAMKRLLLDPARDVRADLSRLSREWDGILDTSAGATIDDVPTPPPFTPAGAPA